MIAGIVSGILFLIGIVVLIIVLATSVDCADVENKCKPQCEPVVGYVNCQHINAGWASGGQYDEHYYVNNRR